MASRQPRQLFKGKLVEQKISRLAVLRSDDFKHIPTSSPAYKDLHNGSSRVKKLSKLFEEKSKTYSSVTNWWLDEKTQLANSESPPPLKPRNSIGRLSNSPIKLSTKLERIVNELLQKELIYVESLERGIENYVKVIKEGAHDVPKLLQNQTFKLFGNIEEIYKLHRDSVYPRLMICNNNAQLIAETISSLIQNDLFYCYIVYAINQKPAEQLITFHSDYFERLRNSNDDLLGIYSFIIQPIQKLPRYKMLLDEMIKELSKDLVTNKAVVAACCVAEKSVKRLLSRLNSSLAINDIVETHELEVADQMSFITSMQKNFGVNINDPTMILMPKGSSSLPFRSPINVYDLGKFFITSTMRATECWTGRTFPAKVFLFEKCLLYTKMINERSLGYRNHFPFISGFAFHTKESQMSFRVSSVKKKFDVVFSSDNMENIVEIKKLINRFYDPRRSGDSAFVDCSNELMVCEENSCFTEDEDEDWLVAECTGDPPTNLDETLHVANSRFYIKSPEPESD